MLSPKTVVCLLFMFAFLISVATADTQFSFSSFSPESRGEFFTIGDAAYDAANRSYIVNPGARTPAASGSCGALFYAKAVHIQNGATGRVASFSTSFSFSYTMHGLPRNYSQAVFEGTGFGFVIIPKLHLTDLNKLVSKPGTVGACRRLPVQTQIETITLGTAGFHVNFETDYIPNVKQRLSNNFIRVGKNIEHEYDLAAYTHNLCGNDTHCSYFSNGRILTAWIDLDSSSQTLEIRMADGSSAVPKPLQPLLRIPNYRFPKTLVGDVFLTFWGSSDVHRLEEHEFLSWSFSSTGMAETSKLRMMLHYLKTKTWVGTTGGVLLGTMVALVIFWSIFSFAKPGSRYTALGYSTGPRVFSYYELRKATANFNERNLLGRGGSGGVYKGSFEGGGVLVAVKQINMLEDKKAQALFHAEVESLTQIRHRNVVSLYGWCQEKGKLLLVYEYMSNGTLNNWLYNNESQKVLSLKMRHSILEGVGAALGYLHKDCLNSILHRDIKSSNVLLDANFKAYIGDFGLARLINHEKLDKTTLAAGTFGYMAPELPYTGKATKESDVYSFGILILEVVCGKHPLDLQATEPEDLVLLYTVWRAHEGRSLFDLADPRMLGTFEQSSRFEPDFDERSQVVGLPLQSSKINYKIDSKPIVSNVDFKIQMATVVSLLQLGLFCCLPNPKARPSMTEVNRLLQEIRNIEYESPIMTTLMPSLPATKPLGVYDSLEFSCKTILETSVSSVICSPTSLV